MMALHSPRFVLALALLLGVVATAHAQSADTHFHAAANQYIGGEDAAALAAVEAGLRLAPNDARLLRLKEEIERQREQQNQKQNQNQNQQQQGDDPQQQGQNQPQQDQDGAEGQPPEQQDPGERGEGDPQQQQGQPDAQPDEAPTGEQPARPQPDPNRLSQAEAERILQALGNEEETLLRRMARPQTRARRVEKDW